MLYDWVAGGPDITFPDEVGFEIGGDSGIDYLVLQIHYVNHEHSEPSHGLIDDSGVVVATVSGPNHGITKLAGCLTLSYQGSVPMGVSRQTVACDIREDKVIHPFSFLPHTHELGFNMGIYKVPRQNLARRILIGEADPRDLQIFYPVSDESLVIEKGDWLMSFCDYNNTRNKVVNYGESKHDEMCNLFLMYWIEGDKLEEGNGWFGCFNVEPNPAIV